MSNELKIIKDLDNNTLIMEREFDAPKEKVWKAYTDKYWFEKWWGPEGWITKTKEFNFVPGGIVHYSMECVDKNQGDWFGKIEWSGMQIESVDANNSFSYRDFFADENGAVKNDMPVITVTNTFTEQNGKTKLISTSVADSAGQIEQLIQMGMAEGFTSQLLKLDALLAE